MKDKIINMATLSIHNFNLEMAKDVISESIRLKLDPFEIIEKGFKKGIIEVGTLYEKGILCLPHIIIASEIMKFAVSSFKSNIEKRKLKNNNYKIIICTIEGDIHTIGKDIVALMLCFSGFEVIDLGRDVLIKDIIDKTIKEKPLLIATSALMTTTIINQQLLEKKLKSVGIRNKVKTMIGGGACNQEWANKIGADIYGENVFDAIFKVKKILHII